MKSLTHNVDSLCGPDIFRYAGAYATATTITFTVGASSSVPTSKDIIAVLARHATGELHFVDIQSISVAVTGAHPNYTLTVNNASFPATGVFDIFVRDFVRGYITLTNHFRTDLITRQDNLEAPFTAASAVTVTQNTELFLPANAVTKTACWDTFSLNAGGGKVNKISFTGVFTTAALSNAQFKMYATDDPNATIASKLWRQMAFIDDMTGLTVTSLSFVGGAAPVVQEFLVSVAYPFDKRYLLISLAETNNVGNITLVSIFGSAGV